MKKFCSVAVSLALVIALLGIAGCVVPAGSSETPTEPQTSHSASSPASPSANESGATSAGVKRVVNANNQFALELYPHLKEKGGNTFYSPYSISVALAMTYEGARGKTAEEIESVLHLPKDDSVRRPCFARIYNQLNRKDREYKLHTAKALWAQEDYPFLEDYLDVTKSYYAAKVANLDFVKETEKSRKTINQWVEDKTEDKIENLIPRGILGKLTRLVLTNAIYFKGEWITQFDKEKTEEADFRTGTGKTVKVPMMCLTGEKFNYAETNKLQTLEMPYAGKELSMLVLLPKEDSSLEELEKSISAEKLQEWKDKLAKKEVDIYMPRFKVETKYFLADTLKEMGMPTAFSREANFSGMDGTRKLFISKVIHQAFVKVNEEGTEAAAATGVVVGLTAVSPPNVFRADHPFMFIIEQRETGNILFLGTVANPEQ